ncbi:MAG: hypothetical protein EXS50_03725 [Candidatus Taylorbacteria bacterium]|nr:hypothetical protein [Candidatus Taylorbacteria bacterium]
MAKKSKISTTIWGLVLGATATVDVVQLFLDGFAIGLIANRLIDIFMGMTLPFTFWCMGVKLNSKRVAGIALSFLMEMIPGLDALPTWSADVIYTWVSVKAEEKGVGVPAGAKEKLQALKPRIPKNIQETIPEETYAQERQEETA